MYEYFKGSIAYKREDFFVLEANGIGYKIFCAPPLIDLIPSIGEETIIYTHLIVREDVLALYGFKDPEQQKMFELLLTVSGVGPKVAGLLVANIQPSQFAMAVLSGDTDLIASVKGIGKKGAQRVILELKDKLKGVSFDQNADVSIIPSKTNNQSSKYQEVCSALTVLGYAPKQALDATNKVYDDNISVEEIIRLALRELM